MAIKFSFTLVLCLGFASSQDVADVPHPQTGSSLLQQAVRYLVNYTASEARAHMDMDNIGSTVAAIAYEKLTEKLGRHNIHVVEAFN